MLQGRGLLIPMFVALVSRRLEKGAGDDIDSLVTYGLSKDVFVLWFWFI